MKIYHFDKHKFIIYWYINRVKILPYEENFFLCVGVLIKIRKEIDIHKDTMTINFCYFQLHLKKQLISLKSTNLKVKLKQ